MFMHYSIILIIFRKKKYQIDQQNYNNLFKCIENNLRELGFGDISVNTKMKNLNKIFYDILIKFSEDQNEFKINKKLIIKYFEIFIKNETKWKNFELYFIKFYKFCFELSPKTMVEDLKKYKY